MCVGGTRFKATDGALPSLTTGVSSVGGAVAMSTYERNNKLDVQLNVPNFCLFGWFRYCIPSSFRRLLTGSTFCDEFSTHHLLKHHKVDCRNLWLFLEYVLPKYFFRDSTMFVTEIWHFYLNTFCPKSASLRRRQGRHSGKVNKNETNR